MRLHLSLLSILVFSCFHLHAQTTYYVCSSCTTSANLGSLTDPWIEIQDVNGEMSNFQEGDQILFKKGDTWVDTFLNVNASGASGNLIKFGSYGTGNKPIIDCGPNGLSIGIRLISDNYIEINDIEVRNSSDAGISISGSHSVEVKWCKVKDAGKSGIAIAGCNNLLVKGCFIQNPVRHGIAVKPESANADTYDITIEDCRIDDAGESCSGEKDGIELHSSGGYELGSGFIIKKCEISRTIGWGIDINSGSEVIIESNTSKNNRKGGLMIGVNAYNVIVRYNDFSDEATPVGSCSGDYGGAVKVSGDIVELYYNILSGSNNYLIQLRESCSLIDIINNVLVLDEVSGGSGNNEALIIESGAEDIRIYNNIFYNYRNTCLGTSNKYLILFQQDPSGGQIECNYNLYWDEGNSGGCTTDSDDAVFFYGSGFSFNTFDATYGQEPAGIFDDPDFVNPSVGDFSLSSTSPAIDAGWEFGYERDFAGNDVPNLCLNAYEDIGAIEYDPDCKWDGSIDTIEGDEDANVETAIIGPYPNPAVTNTNVFVPVAQKINYPLIIDLVDLVGRNVFHRVYPEIQVIQIETVEFATGSYLMKIYESDGKLLKEEKLVVTR